MDRICDFEIKATGRMGIIDDPQALTWNRKLYLAAADVAVRTVKLNEPPNRKAGSDHDVMHAIMRELAKNHPDPHVRALAANHPDYIRRASARYF